MVQSLPIFANPLPTTETEIFNYISVSASDVRHALQTGQIPQAEQSSNIRPFDANLLIIDSIDIIGTSLSISGFVGEDKFSLIGEMFISNLFEGLILVDAVDRFNNIEVLHLGISLQGNSLPLFDSATEGQPAFVLYAFDSDDNLIIFEEILYNMSFDTAYLGNLQLDPADSGLDVWFARVVDFEEYVITSEELEEMMQATDLHRRINSSGDEGADMQSFIDFSVDEGMNYILNQLNFIALSTNIGFAWNGNLVTRHMQYHGDTWSFRGVPHFHGNLPQLRTGGSQPWNSVLTMVGSVTLNDRLFHNQSANLFTISRASVTIGSGGQTHLQSGLVGAWAVTTQGSSFTNFAAAFHSFAPSPISQAITVAQAINQVIPAGSASQNGVIGLAAHTRAFSYAFPTNAHLRITRSSQHANDGHNFTVRVDAQHRPNVSPNSPMDALIRWNFEFWFDGTILRTYSDSMAQRVVRYTIIN